MLIYTRRPFFLFFFCLCFWLNVIKTSPSTHTTHTHAHQTFPLLLPSPVYSVRQSIRKEGSARDRNNNTQDSQSPADSKHCLCLGRDIPDAPVTVAQSSFAAAALFVRDGGPGDMVLILTQSIGGMGPMQWKLMKILNRGLALHIIPMVPEGVMSHFIGRHHFGVTLLVKIRCFRTLVKWQIVDQLLTTLYRL